MSIYSLLKIEHLEIRAMLWSLENMAKDKPGEFSRLKKELISHGRAERQAVYGKVAQAVEDDEFLEDEENSHQEIERMLESMAKENGRRWKESLKELKGLVEHHIDEEEQVMFDKMKGLFSAKEARFMSRQYLEAKDKESGRYCG